VTKSDGTVKARYDYLPYGEEIPSSIGGRSGVAGYGAADSTKQKFTSKERDNESGLDYFLARYYSSAQSRFTSVDPENAGTNSDDPQSWNGYAYARNNPILYSDPDGQKYLICGPDGCGYLSDEEFYRERDRFATENNRLTYTGNRDWYENGDILGPDGEWLASYQQISIDDRAQELSYELRERFRDPATYKRAAVKALIGIVISRAASRGIARIETRSGSRTAALAEAKKANNIPVSKSPDRVIKPDSPEGNQIALRPGENVRLYEYTNSNGQKIWIREDKSITYSDGSSQGPHFNSGPAGQKLTGHHYWQQ
jgi:RHS repeat-associated protein